MLERQQGPATKTLASEDRRDKQEEPVFDAAAQHTAHADRPHRSDHEYSAMMARVV